MIDLTSLIEQCAPNVAPTTLERIIRVESTFRPHAIGYKIKKNGATYTLTQQPVNMEEAISYAQWLYSNGYQFDAGITQVRSTNFARFGLTPETAFDPCLNIRAGGKILTEFYERAVSRFGAGQYALLSAIDAYNRGNFSGGIATDYVAKVTGFAAYPKRSASPSPQRRTIGSAPRLQADGPRTTYNAPTTFPMQR